MVNPSKLKLVLLETVRHPYLPRASAFVRCVKVSGNELMRAVTLTGCHHVAPRTGQVSVEHKFLFSRIPPVMSPCEQLGLLPMPRAFSAGQDSSIFHDRRDFNFYYSMQMKLWFIVTFPSFGLAAPNLSVDLEVRRFGLVFIVKLCNNGLIGGWL